MQKAIAYFAIGGKGDLESIMSNAFAGKTMNPKQMMGEKMVPSDM